LIFAALVTTLFASLDVSFMRLNAYPINWHLSSCFARGTYLLCFQVPSRTSTRMSHAYDERYPLCGPKCLHISKRKFGCFHWIRSKNTYFQEKKF